MAIAGAQDCKSRVEVEVTPRFIIHKQLPDPLLKDTGLGLRPLRLVSCHGHEQSRIQFLRITDL